MKISIIVPVYNVAAYLDRCIRSALALKTSLELILIDDGSTDGSGKLCDEWAARDGRIVLIRQENRGLSETRNQGIRESRGEYVLFLDGDDFLDPEQADRMLDSLDGTQTAAIGLYRNYFPGKERFSKEHCAGFLALRGSMTTERFLDAVPKDGRSCYMIAPRFIVKREFLLENALLFRAEIYHEDEEWTQRLLCRVESVFVTHYFFYCYRQGREGSITSAVTGKHIADSFTILALADTLRRTQTGARERYLRSRMAQLFLSNMIHVPGLPKDQQEQAFQMLESYAPLCLPHLAGPIGNSAKLMAHAVGIRQASKILWRVGQAKKKWMGG